MAAFAVAMFPTTWTHALAWAVCNGAAHMAVDFFTSRGSHYYFDAKRYKAGFCVIGFDQLAHQACMILSLGAFL
jgi:hypothetical protein